jgi:MiaB-like tRNA modifying enzyme
VYVINTCTVTGESDRKSRQLIRRAVKTGGGTAVVMATGCFTQVSPEEARKIEGLDYIGGNKNKTILAEKAKELLQKKREGDLTVQFDISDIASESVFETMTVHTSDRTRAFVKIVDGCQNNCSYCIIPKARGPVRSKPQADVLAELSGLIQNDYKEIVLTGIETAEYGRDLEDTNLLKLLCAADSLPGLSRIRLGSLDPTLFRPEFVRQIATLPKVMPHFHISLQSGSDRILAMMRRKYNTAQFYEKLCLLREHIPNVTFTTDMIVGFPGETEEMFAETLAFTEKCSFLYAHIFPYSKRSGTDAAEMKGQIPEEVKKQRAAILKEKMMSVRIKEMERYSNTCLSILAEKVQDGAVFGYTTNYIEVHATGTSAHGEIIQVSLEKPSCDGEYMIAKI